MSVTLY